MHPDGYSRVYSRVTLADLKTVTGQLLNQYGQYTIWLFYGDMGAGKTTLIKALGDALGVTDTVSSPTFAIINEYLTGSGKKIFHFDFYRIRHETEAYDIGVEEYFYSGSPCFVEWPERIPSLIPEVHIAIRITREDSTYRTIAISVHDRKEENGI